MDRIEVYVQMGMAAELATSFSIWGDAEKSVCQQIADLMKLEVRAMRAQKCLGVFYPQHLQNAERKP